MTHADFLEGPFAPAIELADLDITGPRYTSSAKSVYHIHDYIIGESTDAFGNAITSYHDCCTACDATQPPPAPPTTTSAANVQTTLRFAPSGTAAPPPAAQNGESNSGSAASTDSTASTASESQVFPVTVYQQQQLQQPEARPTFAHAPLHWTAISPEWFSVVVPKLPNGFVVEMSAPTVHCSGMVSFKRATSADENDA